MVVGDPGQRPHRLARDARDLDQGLGLDLRGVRHGGALALAIGLLADRLDLLGQEVALGPRRLGGDDAGVVEDGVEVEGAGLGHQ